MEQALAGARELTGRMGVAAEDAMAAAEAASAERSAGSVRTTNLVVLLVVVFALGWAVWSACSVTRPLDAVIGVLDAQGSQLTSTGTGLAGSAEVVDQRSAAAGSERIATSTSEVVGTSQDVRTGVEATLAAVDQLAAAAGEPRAMVQGRCRGAARELPALPPADVGGTGYGMPRHAAAPVDPQVGVGR